MQCFINKNKRDDLLKTNCQLNNFGFICNDNVMRDYLWKDGVYLFYRQRYTYFGRYITDNFLNCFLKIMMIVLMTRAYNFQFSLF